ncbi:MAG: LytTR family DNA-binding domain-containing protein [Gammaproteobacteria bacterium]|nr:LytTR family DNA-binding domain-containing protein [Gammaproteobacteria bacterium]
MELARSYWTLTLTPRLGLGELSRLLLLVYALVFASVVVLHLSLPGPWNLAHVLLHGTQIAVTYVLWFAVLGGLLAVADTRGWVRHVRVWHVWAVSAASYLLGFFLVVFDDPLTLALHEDVHSPGQISHFLRLSPVWLAVTWVFTQTYLGRNRRVEIERLTRLNERLAAARPEAAAEQPRVRLEAGRTGIDLPADAVTHVSVDDHYCYVHYRQAGQWRKTAVGMPLKELMAQLPEPFVQIHRSHAVNVHAVSRLQRSGRALWIWVGDDGVRLPLSRYRSAQVLPRLTLESQQRQPSA